MTASISRYTWDVGEIKHSVARSDYSEDQPRANDGKWTSGGGGGSASASSGKSTEHQFRHADGTWDPSRKALHQRYIDAVTRGVPVSPEPTVYMTGGGPGSGKTTAVINNPQARLPDNSKAAHIDPDTAKGFIPEYKEMREKYHEGAAALVHEESAHMAKEALTRALQGGHDVVYDSTGDGGIEKLTAKVEAMRAHGAKRVVADYVTISTAEAVKRADARALKDPQHRYVPHEFIQAAHRDAARTSLDALKSGLFDSMRFWDNTTSPRVIATYDRASGLKVLDEAAFRAYQQKAEE